MFGRPSADNSPIRYGAALLLVWGLVASLPAAAEVEVPWAHEPYAYVVVDQEVRMALEAFGRNLDLPMDIGQEVQGKAQRNLRAATAGEFLDRLCTGSGLNWFYDGSVLHVGSMDALAVRQITPEGFGYEQLREALDEQGISGQHLALKPSVHGGEEILVAGPPPYLALVERTVQRLRPAGVPSAPVAQPREQGVRVFRGSAPVERVAKDSSNER